MARKWKKEEVTYLKRYAKGRRTDELASRFRTDSTTVAAKLEELGLSAADSVMKIKLEHDPSVKIYEKGVKAMQRGNWAEARKAFTQVIEDGDRRELAARSRQYLEVCERNLEKSAKDDADPYLEAVYERNRGNFEEALAICSRGGRQGKDERFAYLAASIHASQGDAEEAVKMLSTAIELNPKNRVHAFHDSDFSELKDNEGFASLLEAS